jgi:voltage-gated potassium channel
VRGFFGKDFFVSDEGVYKEIFGRFIKAAIAIIVILVVGTLGYYLFTDGRYSLFDCFYMVFITVTTIGFGETIDLAANPAGRIWTIIIALSGIGVLFYGLSNATAFFVEEDLTNRFRRRKMDKKISELRDHFIVCGAGLVGYHVIAELFNTERKFVVVELDSAHRAKIEENFPDQLVVEGNATEERILKKAGIEHAKGLFAVTEDDNQNLVISLTARHLNSGLKIVSRCIDLEHAEKMKKAGADSVISPNFIGGLRMATEMVKPTVVSFLDTMLRDQEKNLRVEEYTVPEDMAGKSISELPLKDCKYILLMALKNDQDWVYAPGMDYKLEGGDTLVFMATPQERRALERLLG